MRGLLFASAVIVLVAVSAPSLFSRYLDGGGSGNVRMSSREAFAREGNNGGDISSRENSSYATSRLVTVEAERDGDFYVDAEINFRPVRLIVDTGASVVALRESDAATVGIRPRPGDFVHPVQTANGTTSAAEATLDSVSVDDIEVRNVRALVLPDDQLAISLLGASFLNGLDRFEVADGTLVMEN